jgi:hypothetical protein
VISVLAGDALFFFLDAGAMNLSTKRGAIITGEAYGVLNCATSPTCHGRPLGRTDFGSVMIQSLPPRAARCYALRPSLSGSCPRPCGSEQASGMIIDGSGQEGAICGVDQPTITG